MQCERLVETIWAVFDEGITSFGGGSLRPYIQSKKLLLAWNGGLLCRRVSAVTVAATEEVYDIDQYEWSKEQSEDNPKHPIPSEEFGAYPVNDL